MDTTRTPLRSIHPTRPLRRPKLRPTPKHHVLHYLIYFEEKFDPVLPQDAWHSTFPWSMTQNPFKPL